MWMIYWPHHTQDSQTMPVTHIHERCGQWRLRRRQRRASLCVLNNDRGQVCEMHGCDCMHVDQMSDVRLWGVSVRMMNGSSLPQGHTWPSRAMPIWMNEKERHFCLYYNIIIMGLTPLLFSFYFLFLFGFALLTIIDKIIKE